MKGMDRVIRGHVFLALLSYCEGRGSKRGQVPDGRLIGGNMSGTTVAELAAEFAAARRLRPEIEKATWHNSLRLPLGDRISDEKWRDVTMDYMRRMGFSPSHPFCVWAHDDEGAVHIAASRIGYDGSVYLGRNENLASTRHIQDLEAAHGLRCTQGPVYENPQDPPSQRRPIKPQRRAILKPELEQAVRTGVEPRKARLQRLLDEAAEGAPSVVELAERLEAEGVEVRANVASTGTLSGLSFEVDGVSFKGSDLGKRYGWKGLQALGVTYEQIRDGKGLERFSGAARASARNGRSSGADCRAFHPGSPAREPVDGVDTSRVGGESGAAATDTGPGRTDRADSRGDVGDPSPATLARGGDRKAFGDADPDHGRPAAVHREARRAPNAAEAGQLQGTGQPPGGGLVSQAVGVQDALRRDHQAKIGAWRRQAMALGAPAYRVSLIERAGKPDGRKINMGIARVPDQAETFFDMGAVEELIPRLRWHNAKGFDVYITPIDPAHHYLVIDDMKSGAVRLLAHLEHTPCLVQSSSAGNEQAVLKVPKSDRPDEQALANKLVLGLNKEHGDPKFSGAVHAFRMAGFSNKKAGRANAFTRILEAVPRLCSSASALLQRMRLAADEFAFRAHAKRRQEQAEAGALQDAQQDRKRAELEGDSESTFRGIREFVRLSVRQRGLVEDLSRVDYQAAIDMLSAGWTDIQVEAGMLASSEGLASRHSNPAAYARHTVKKAKDALALSASKASASLRPNSLGK